jgi:NAD(P)-dependent dehydrogenase (short-subunit alcohol dehydrogenase family)
VSSADEVQKVIKDVFADFGRIDVLVANAGMAVSQPLLEQSLEDYRKQMSVNVDGVVYCAKFVGEIFKKQGFGNLIITSSMSAHIVNVPVDQPVSPCLSRASRWGRASGPALISRYMPVLFLAMLLQIYNLTKVSSHRSFAQLKACV